jgi:hypothetical protein
MNMPPPNQAIAPDANTVVPAEAKPPMLSWAKLADLQVSDVLLILKTYVIAFVFVGLFLLLLHYGSNLKASVSQPVWALMLAICLTVPLTVPWLAASVIPRLRSIKISEVEIELERPDRAQNAMTLAAGVLSSSLGESPVLSEYASQMTSLSSSIIDAIKTVQAANHVVLPVDLSTRWVLPNLYFLALMAAQKSPLQQIAFIDSRTLPDRFICNTSPLELLTALEWREPEFRQAAQRAMFDQDPRNLELAAGAEFFNQLSSIYQSRPGFQSERLPTLTPEALLWLLGSAAHRDSVQWSDPAGEKEYRAVLDSESPFVAALNGSQLLALVSRDRVATAVARAALRQA